MTMLAAALELADLGFRIFPIWPGAKNPITSNGFLDASTDAVRIRQWWGKHPKANIGIATGRTATGEMFVVLDLDEHDPNESGNDAWAEIAAEHGEIDTVEALTASGGGRHLYLLVPTLIGNGAAANLPAGIDVRGEGGYVVAAPSTFKGGTYRWEASGDPTDGAEMAQAPEWLVDVLTRTPPTRTSDGTTRERTTTSDGNRPGDRWARRTSWADLLEPDGAKYIDTRTHFGSGTTYETWARPGCERDHGELHTGATLYYLDSDVLKVHTSAWPSLREGETYTKFGYVAATRFGGDMTKTLEWVRSEELAMLQVGTVDPSDPWGDRPHAWMMPGLDPTPIDPRRPEGTAAPMTSGADDVAADSGDGGVKEPEVVIGADGVPKLRVVVNGVPQDELVAEILDAVRSHNDRNPSIFMRSGSAVRIRADEMDRPILEPLDPERFRSDAAKVIAFCREGKTGYTPCFLPIEAARAVLAERRLPFPQLDGITRTPLLRPDGTFQVTHGYDPATRQFLWCPDGDYRQPPATPSAEEIAAAVTVIEDVLADFPFDTTSDRANAWGLLMTLITRRMVNSAQIALVDAPTPGTGKTLLVKVLVWIATGGPTAMQTLPKLEEEVEKRITSTLAAGEQLMVFDNVSETIDSASIANATTNNEWTGRILGTSQQVRLPNYMTWIMTGNSIRTSSEIVRRCYRVRLDAREANPDLRTGFRHPNLLSYVRDNRTQIVEAMMVIVRAWVVAGRPKGSATRTGEFPEWADMIGGILDHAGVTGFLENMMELRETADAERDEWATFLAAWADAAQGKYHAVNDMVRWMISTSPQSDNDEAWVRVGEMLPGSLAGYRHSSKLNQRLGNTLSRLVGQANGGLRIVRGPKNRTKAQTYTVIPADAPIESFDQLPEATLLDSTATPCSTDSTATPWDDSPTAPIDDPDLENW